jgi:hypothetical protein
MVGIEPRPLGASSLKLVTMPTELSLLHFVAECKKENFKFILGLL